MKLYETLCEINWMQIMQKKITEQQKEETIKKITSSIKEVSHSNIYRPIYFSYNGEKRFICINGIMPKTKLLLENHYEFELLRLLAIWRGGTPKHKEKFDNTKERIHRLDNNKFGNMNESVETSISALRFISAAFPNENEWMERLIKNIGENIRKLPNGKKRNSLSLYYFGYAYLKLIQIFL